MMNDFSSLLQLPDDLLLAKFLHESVDDMIGKRKMTYENYSSGDMKCNNEDYEATKKCIQNIYREGLTRDSFDMSSHLPVDLQEPFQNCFQIRKNDIFQALAKESVLQDGNNLVENIDWKLKWILGSSDLATIREPLLQISFHCVQRNEEKNEKNLVSVEVDLNQLEQMIEKLEELKKDQKLDSCETN